MMMNESHRAMLRTHGTMVGRILMGLLFVSSGLNILLMSGVENSVSYFDSVGVPLAGLVIWLVLLIKIVGGGALIAGYRSGLAAGVLILFLLGTILFAHLNLEDINLFKNLAIIGGLLYVMAYGPGEGWKVGDGDGHAPSSSTSQPPNPSAGMTPPTTPSSF